MSKLSMYLKHSGILKYTYLFLKNRYTLFQLCYAHQKFKNHFLYQDVYFCFKTTNGKSSFLILANCDVILNKLLVVCIAYIHKHILDFILLYFSGHYGMYTYSSEILNILKSVINQCSPIFSNEIIFLKCNLGSKTHEKK